MTTPPRGAAIARALALLVLVAGLADLAVRLAPPTTWAVPVAAGPIADGWAVVEVRRAPTAVRLDVRGPDGGAAVVELLHRHSRGEPEARVTPRSRVALREGVAPDPVIDAIVARVRDHEQAWFAPPAYVAPRGIVPSTRQRVEARILDLVALGWCVGWLALLPRLARGLAGVRRRTWAAVLGGTALVHGWLASLDLYGVWHANFHGFDRIADVEHGTPPAVAALSLLHGDGYYTVLQGSYRLTAGALGTEQLSHGLAVATVFVLFAWLRTLWERDDHALMGVGVWLGALAFARLWVSASMYVPAVLEVVAALWMFERYVRDQQRVWFVMGLFPAFLAMQTRAEMMVLLPVWVAINVAWRRPEQLRAVWRRPEVVGGLVAAGVAFVPRLLTILDTPPPADLRRGAIDPLADPRLAALLVLIAVGCSGLPWVRARLGGAWALPRGRRAVIIGASAMVGGYALASWWTGGPTERAWQLHPLLDPTETAPWIGGAVGVGAVVGMREAPRRLGALLVSFSVATWIYVGQVDSVSTWVRTGAATLPFLAAMAGPVARLVPPRSDRWVGPAAVLGALLAALWPAWGVTHRAHAALDPKHVQGELIRQARERLPPGSTVVWLAEDDAPPDAAADGFRTTRARIGHQLGPDLRAVGIGAWESGEAPLHAPTFFLRTADCHRPLLARRAGRALAGAREVAWHYLDISEIDGGDRIVIEGLEPGWMDPRCALALAATTETLVQSPLGRVNLGSIYEQIVGTDAAVGLYRLPARSPLSTSR